MDNSEKERVTEVLQQPYWTCRACEHPELCDRERKCCDILLSNEYFAWCMSEHRRCTK
jgi:hypothetical protein